MSGRAVGGERVLVRFVYNGPGVEQQDDQPAASTTNRLCCRRSSGCCASRTTRSSSRAVPTPRALLASQPVRLVMTDFRMPGMDGASFLRKVRKRHPHTLRLTRTAHGNTEAVMGAIQPARGRARQGAAWTDDRRRTGAGARLADLRMNKKRTSRT